MSNKLCLVLSSLAFALSCAAVEAAPISIAVVGSPAVPAWNADVVAKLTATGAFSSVTVLDPRGSTPSLATLQSFAAVLFYSDTVFADPTALGNNLADYVDAGGGAVEMMFAPTSSVFGIGGRYRTGGYEALTPGNASGSADLTLGTIHVAGSPIMTGVTSFDGGASSYTSMGALTAGAVDIADWSNGSPLVATKTTNGHTTVELNFYPVSSDVRADFWKSSTQGALLMANALVFASGNATVPSAVPEPGTLSLFSLALVGLGLARRRKAR